MTGTRYHRTAARTISKADLIGGTEIDTGRYILLAYNQYSDVPGRSDNWFSENVFVKISQPDDLPLGQKVTIPHTGVVVSGYSKSTWYFNAPQTITGSITRLASTNAGHRLAFDLHYTDRKGKSRILLKTKVLFRAAPDYFQPHRVDNKGKYDDLRLALKEPAKVKTLDLVSYAIDYKQKHGRDSGPDTLYQRLGELYNLEALNLHLSNLESLPESMRKLKCLKNLNLGYNHLVKFPELLFELDSLQELNLEWNRLDSIPERVAQFRQLTKLNLGDNRLNHYPTAVNAITSLRVLGLANTNLRSLPTQIQQLANLEKLSLDGFWNVKRRNQLQDITALYGLPKLRSLSLKDNGTIELLAPQLYQLHKLRGLEELNLEWNSGVAELDKPGLPKLTDWKIEEEEE